VFPTSVVDFVLYLVCPGTSDLGDVYVSDSLSTFVMVGFQHDGSVLNVLPSFRYILRASYYFISVEYCFLMFELHSYMF
jgi:hypothetical protein